MGWPDPVQSNHYEGGAGEDSRGLAFPGSVTSGNLLSCSYTYDSGGENAGDPTITDNLADGISWSFRTKQCYVGTSKTWVGIAYKVAGASAACTVTVNPPGASAYITFQIAEWPNIAADPFDQEAGAQSYTAGTAVATGNSPATTQDEELVIACCAYDGATTTIPACATDYSELYSYEDGSSYMPLNTSYKAVAATGAQSATWNPLGAARAWGCALATFKKAGGGAATPLTASLSDSLIYG